MYDSIPLCRSIFRHWIYQDAEYLKVWVTMLGRAKYTFGIEKKIYRGVIYEIDRGQFVFGRPTWVEECDVSESRLKTLLRKLTTENMIEVVKQYPKFTIYKIINYEKFNQQKHQQNDQQTDEENQGLQGFDDQQNDQQSDQRVSSKCPADDQQVSNNKESKEAKQGKQKKEKIYIPEVDEIWNYYLSKIVSMGKKRIKTSSKLDHINARLEQGFNVEQLKTVIDNVFSDKWMLGENPNKKEYIEIENFMCNAEKVEKWSNKRGDENKNGGSKDNNQPDFSYYDNTEYTGPIYDDSEFI